jgi:hypothetical protein
MHFVSPSDTLYYYLEAFSNSTYNNNTNSTITTDAIEGAIYPPTAPSVYSPTAESGITLNSNITINWTASIPSPFAFILSYNLTLVNTTFGFVKGIVNLTNNTLGYSWNTTGVTAGTYHVVVTVIDNNTLSVSGYSEQFFILNTVPQITALSLTQQPGCSAISNPTYHGVVINCQSVTLDSVSSLLNITYSFYRNGTVYSSATSTGVSANTTHCSMNEINVIDTVILKSDTWLCGARAYNGVDYSAWVNTSGATINNTAPVIGAPTTNNSAPISTSVLLCNNGSYSDADPGDVANNTYYRWWKNGVVLIGNTSSTLDLNTVSAVYGDLYNCSMIRSDSGYDMKNSTEKFSTSVTVQSPPWTTSTTVCSGASCTPITAIYVDTPLNCSAYIYDNDTATIQELRFNWKLNGTTDTTRYSYSVPNATLQYASGNLWANVFPLGFTYFAKSDNIYCESRGYDGIYYGTYDKSAYYTVNNTAPTINNPIVSSYNPTNTSVITCTGAVGYVDTDLDALNATYYKWFHNGAVVIGNTTNTLNLFLVNVSDGDVVYCENTVSDSGYDMKNSTPHNSSAVTIGTITSLHITICPVGFPVLNFTVRDEQTLALINATMEATFTLYNYTGAHEQISNVSFYIQNQTSFSYCISPYSAITLVNSYQTYYPFTGTAYSQRNYYLVNATLNASSPQNIDIYLLNETVGTAYTFQVVNQYSVPISGALLTVSRFMPATNTWVIVEQQVTDFSGYSLFDLQAGTLYKLVTSASGYVSLNTDFTPGAVTSVQIRLQRTSGTVTPVPDFEQVFNDVTFKVLPTGFFYNTSVLAAYQINSSAGLLTNYSMTVTRRYNGTTTIVYSAAVTASPSGGTLTYTATLPGAYTVQVQFKHANYSNYFPIPTNFFIGNTTGAAIVKDIFSTGFIGGWAFYFVALVVTMVAAGFALRYSPEASGAVGLLVLWGFTFLYPAGVIVTVAGVGITVLMATILTSLMVGAAMFLKWYV